LFGELAKGFLGVSVYPRMIIDQAEELSDPG
jgi:hypothetical protein